MAEEMGLIGVSVFLVTLALFFYNAFQAWFTGLSRDTLLAPILLGVAGVVLGAMIGGLTDHYFFNLNFPHSAVLFWLYVGRDGCGTIGGRETQLTYWLILAIISQDWLIGRLL